MRAMPKKVKVSIRLRSSDGGTGVWSCLDNTIYSVHKGKQVSYDGFETVFSNKTNAEVYELCVREDIQRFLQDENCTIFAYGQTGSGKTHTMLGGDEEGIIKLGVKEILSSRPVGISYLEIYNERLFDLSSNNEVQMFSVGSKNIISNLWIENVSKWEDAAFFIERCERNRRFGTTEFNTKSSRSHTVFQVTYSNNNRIRTLNMIDLAGSERASRSMDRRKEGSFINKSLLALCTVVNNIGYGRYTGFRDSKLTRILQPSLDGYTNLVAICTLSPYENCVEESISTLKFAARLSNLELRTSETAVPPRAESLGGSKHEQRTVDVHCNSAETTCKNGVKQTCYTDLFHEAGQSMSEMDGACTSSPTSSKTRDKNVNVEASGEGSENGEMAQETLVFKSFKAFESIIIGNLQRKIKMLEELNTVNEDRIVSLENMVGDMLRRNPSKKINKIFILEKYMFSLRKGMVGKK